MAFASRLTLRSRYGVPEDYCYDCMCFHLCFPCQLCVDYKELEMRLPKKWTASCVQADRHKALGGGWCLSPRTRLSSQLRDPVKCPSNHIYIHIATSWICLYMWVSISGSPKRSILISDYLYTHIYVQRQHRRQLLSSDSRAHVRLSMSLLLYTRRATNAVGSGGNFN
jgi:hypothetical protein